MLEQLLQKRHHVPADRRRQRPMLQRKSETQLDDRFCFGKQGPNFGSDRVKLKAQPGAKAEEKHAAIYGLLNRPLLLN